MLDLSMFSYFSTQCLLSQNSILPFVQELKNEVNLSFTVKVEMKLI